MGFCPSLGPSTGSEGPLTGYGVKSVDGVGGSVNGLLSVNGGVGPSTGAV